ncbi:MAG: hypothetical protein KAQ98_14675 [Bacteriovoracaceae bacterium]|nr:hypothetical protein [Bacteriovoracaceae bacterium]
MSHIGEKLGLKPLQTKLLFSCQYHLVRTDINKIEQDKEKKHYRSTS